MNKFRDAVARLFRARPNQDISYRELMEVGGQMAWRTRVSECRVDLGMNIPKPKQVTDAHGVVTTYYRYEPPAEPKQLPLGQAGVEAA